MNFRWCSFQKSHYEILKNFPNFYFKIFFIWTHSEVEQSSLKVWDVKIKKYIMQTTVHFSHYFFLHPFLHMVCPNIGISHCTLSNNLVANILFWKRRKILLLSSNCLSQDLILNFFVFCVFFWSVIKNNVYDIEKGSDRSWYFSYSFLFFKRKQKVLTSVSTLTSTNAW